MLSLQNKYNIDKIKTNNRTMRKTFLLLAAFLPALASAQTFDFDMTQVQPVFSESAGYGYDKCNLS